MSTQQPLRVPASAGALHVTSHLRMALAAHQDLAQALKAAFLAAEAHSDPRKDSIEQLELGNAAFGTDLAFVVEAPRE